MEKIKSWDELKKFRSDIKNETETAKSQTVVAVGMATCGVAAGANEIMAAIQDEMGKEGIKDVKIAPTGCYGFCYAEPMVEVRTAEKIFRYGPVDDALAREIVRKHVKGGEAIEANLITQEVERA
jgi:NADP-reducing hydrogenase subunit HndB